MKGWVGDGIDNIVKVPRSERATSADALSGREWGKRNATNGERGKTFDPWIVGVIVNDTHTH